MFEREEEAAAQRVPLRQLERGLFFIALTLEVHRERMHRLQGAAASDARADERPRLGHALVSRKPSDLFESAPFLCAYVVATLDNGNLDFSLRETRREPMHMAFQQRSSHDDVAYRLPAAYGVIETRLINGEEQTTARNKRRRCLGAG